MQINIDRSTLQDAAEAACRAGLRTGLSEVDAGDLAQEALVRALSTARPPEGVPLAAWVYGIARNLGRDHAKSARSREVLVDDLPERAAGHEDLATVLAVRRAVSELPEPLRDVILLHELEEHSLRETAAALEIPFDTAKDRLRRAREQLRLHLADPQTSCSDERAHSRRRAAACGAAVMAAVWVALGTRAAAAAAGRAPAPPSVLRGWVTAVAAGTIAVGGFAAGRLSAPTRDPIPSAVTLPSEPVTSTAKPTPTDPAPAPGSVDAPTGPRAPAFAGSLHLGPGSLPTPPASVARSRTSPRAAADPDRHREAERLLLDRARVGLQRGMPEEALVVLMAHAREFPTGELAEERDVLLIEAYLRSGNAVLARRRIERYRSDYPVGALHSRVDAVSAELATHEAAR